MVSVAGLDVGALRGLTRLEHLNMNDNRIRTIAPLEELNGLRWLQVGNNRIEDLSPVRSMTKLDYLVIAGNPLQDFSPLLDLQHLRTVTLDAKQWDSPSFQDVKVELLKRRVEVNKK